MIISSEDSDRKYVEDILDKLEKNPLNRYIMTITETRINGEIEDVQISMHRDYSLFNLSTDERMATDEEQI